MKNGATNVDQAFFYGMSFDPNMKGINLENAGMLPENIDVEALREMLDREGSITIRLEENKKQRIEKAIKGADKKVQTEKDDEMTI